MSKKLRCLFGGENGTKKTVVTLSDDAERELKELKERLNLGNTEVD